MDEYVSFLGDTVLTDEKIVTYRLLSRNLKVHVRQAKEMLYEFHKAQNSKKPNSVHATYFLSGYRRQPSGSSNGEIDEDEDTVMRSSPFDSLTQASAAAGPTDDELIRSIVVVPQEKLEEAKASFVRLSSVHVYSVEPGPLSGLTLVSSVGHELLTNFDYNDATEHAHVYGTIANPSAKRRSKVVVPEAPPAAAPTIVRVDKNKNPGISWTKKVQGPKKEESSQEVKKEEPPVTAPSKSTKPAPPSRTQSGSQKFFSNWQSGTKRAQNKKADSKASSAAPTPPSQTEDLLVKMDTDSEGDEEEERIPVRDTAEDIRKRKAKQAELEAMMMDDSDEEPPPPKRKPSPTPAPKPEPTLAPSAQPSTATSSRRRGRRKVQKTVHSKDEDGYLVTKQETVWESFSEDESEPPPAKVKTAAPAAATKTAKGKKAPVAQGNIMSFFQKK